MKEEDIFKALKGASDHSHAWSLLHQFQNAVDILDESIEMGDVVVHACLQNPLCENRRHSFSPQPKDMEIFSPHVSFRHEFLHATCL